MDISRLGMPEEVNEFATRVKPFFDQLLQFKANSENDASWSEKEEQFVRFCDDLLQEHIKSLDKLNVCLVENSSLVERLDEVNQKAKELQRQLWMEKESKIDLKKKFEDDEQQNQDEAAKQEKIIKDLRTKVKSIEKEKKQLYDEKQDLLVQYQNDLAKWEKELAQLQLTKKKLINAKELDELKLLNCKNNVTQLTHELCSLLNLTSSYRRKGPFFGRQFISAFDMVFGRFKTNRSNVTFLETPSISEDPNSSVLSLGDITYEELCNFNIILKEKLIQNEQEITLDEETFINNSKLFCLSNNLANCTILDGSFENRLLGNETFKLASLNELSCQSQLPLTMCDSVALDIFDELLAEETRHQIIRTYLELTKSNQSVSSAYNDQVKFMFKPESLQDESFQEELYNRFEESFSENYARHCATNRNVSSSGHELLKNILDNDGDSILRSQNHSKIDSTIIERSDGALSTNEHSTCRESSKDNQSGGDQSGSDQSSGRSSSCAQPNATIVIKKLAPSDNFSMIANSNDTRPPNFTAFDGNKLKPHSAAKSTRWINSTISSELSKPVSFSRIPSRSSSLSNSSSETGSNRSEELIVTMNKHCRSDGESPTEYSSTDSHCNEPETDTDSHLMHLTNVNNLSNAFTELSGNQKLNSTVKTNEEKSHNLHSTLSSNMRLSDDDLEPVDEQKPEEPNESDPFFVDTMMSKEAALNNLPDFYSTIAHESNHSVANMELSGSTETKSSSQSISLSTFIDKFDKDECVLREDAKEGTKTRSRSSNSRCRSRRR